ncbi:unnamed protein product [Vitrella brassicaformis CCMP3155]|uniref:Uncharacterized protein n=1 Tax=Vitrella brassicaformis (strain CCMP3155) TaxID=1169540 RepID=A0A0G4FA08_VITBC|nr:unnamed protein product [Vitrella brassicaformis CCMP3155]|eukprot:CEM09715.1 unnamed protein product [Vitrella brassicaformis CCMP3155]
MQDAENERTKEPVMYAERRMIGKFRVSADRVISYLLEGRVDVNHPLVGIWRARRVVGGGDIHDVLQGGGQGVFDASIVIETGLLGGYFEEEVLAMAEWCQWLPVADAAQEPELHLIDGCDSLVQVITADGESHHVRQARHDLMEAARELWRHHRQAEACALPAAGGEAEEEEPPMEADDFDAAPADAQQDQHDGGGASRREGEGEEPHYRIDHENEVAEEGHCADERKYHQLQTPHSYLPRSRDADSPSPAALPHANPTPHIELQTHYSYEPISDDDVSPTSHHMAGGPSLSDVGEEGEAEPEAAAAGLGVVRLRSLLRSWRFAARVAAFARQRAVERMRAAFWRWDDAMTVGRLVRLLAGRQIMMTEEAWEAIRALPDRHDMGVLPVKTPSPLQSAAPTPTSRHLHGSESIHRTISPTGEPPAVPALPTAFAFQLPAPAVDSGRPAQAVDSGRTAEVEKKDDSIHHPRIHYPESQPGSGSVVHGEGDGRAGGGDGQRHPRHTPQAPAAYAAPAAAPVASAAPPVYIFHHPAHVPPMTMPFPHHPTPPPLPPHMLQAMIAGHHAPPPPLLLPHPGPPKWVLPPWEAREAAMRRRQQQQRSWGEWWEGWGDFFLGRQ